MTSHWISPKKFKAVEVGQRDARLEDKRKALGPPAAGSSASTPAPSAPATEPVEASLEDLKIDDKKQAKRARFKAEAGKLGLSQSQLTRQRKAAAHAKRTAEADKDKTVPAPVEKNTRDQGSAAIL